MDDVCVVEGGYEEGDVLFDEQIVGVENRKDARCKGRIRPLAGPKDMTAEQWARHCLTHLPYNAACPFCVAGKRANTPRRTSPTDRTLPMLHTDYGHSRDSLSDDLLHFLGGVR